MPLFNPCAGPSPNCCAVLVHKEHCAMPLMEMMVKRIIKDNMKKVFFTIAKVKDYRPQIAQI